MALIEAKIDLRVASSVDVRVAPGVERWGWSVSRM